MTSSSETERIRAARAKFAAMAGSYFLGTFNDNFYKQAVMLLALSSGRQAFQGAAAMAFTLPFIVFAAPAGWLADRVSKRKVVIAAKGLELLASLVGALGIFTGNLWLMVGMVGLMGTQAAFFSPALNGSIPELYPKSYVTQANAILRMIVTVGILVGISLAGVFLDVEGSSIFGVPRGRGLVGLAVVAYALLGLLVSFGISPMPAADPGRPFPWSGPLDTFREVGRIWADRQLGRILVADVFIWSTGVFQLLAINALGKLQFSLDDSGTSLLVASQLIGLAFGGLLAARFARGDHWFRVLVPAGAAMGLLMLAIAGVPWLPRGLQVATLYPLIGFTGMAGGLFLIPCESFLQIRPAPERKGAVWASANFASFSGMSVASGLYVAVSALQPTMTYGALGIASLGFVTWLAYEIKRKEWE